MIVKYKYKEYEYNTEEELLEAHENLTPIGHGPIIEKQITKSDQGDYEITEVYEDVKDPETGEVTKTKKEVKKWVSNIVDVEEDVKVGNIFIYADMTQEHKNMLLKATLKKEQAEILKWYRDHDYYVNKVLVGEWEETEQRYLDYKAERLQKQTRYDEINVELETL